MAKQHQRDRTNYKSKGELNMKFMTTEQLKKCSIFDLVTAAIEVGEKIGTPPMSGVSEKEYANYLNYQRQLSVEAERRDSHDYFVKQLIDTVYKPGQFKGWWDGRDGEMELMSYSIEDLVNEAHLYGLGEGSSHENNNHYAETEYRIRFSAIMDEAKRRYEKAKIIQRENNHYKRQSEWCEFERITSDGVHTIYAHKATGVCYMFGNYGSFTVMLNPDGTPVTIEQITGGTE